MRFSRLLTIPLAYVALTTAAWAQDKAARVGLVIGNTTYAPADPALSAVSTDARQLAEEFRKNNFDVELKENLNLSEMRRAIDTFIDPEDRKALLAAFDGAKVDYVFVDYAGAVHSFTRPDAGSAAISGVAYNEKADKRSWEHMKECFKEAFGR